MCCQKYYRYISHEKLPVFAYLYLTQNARELESWLAKYPRDRNTLILLAKDLDSFFYFPKRYDTNRVRNVEAPGLSLFLCFFLESCDSWRDPSIIFSRVTSMFLLLGKQTLAAVFVRARSSLKVLISESNVSTLKRDGWDFLWSSHGVRRLPIKLEFQAKSHLTRFSAKRNNVRLGKLREKTLGSM